MDYPCICIYDTTVSVWAVAVDQESFRQRVFVALVAFLRRRGWRVTDDPHIVAHYRILRRFRRVGVKGDLRLSLELSGRHLQVELWQDRFNITHPNGGKYEFGKRDKMPPALRLRCDLEVSLLTKWFIERLGYPVRDQRHRGETADERIARDYAESCHTDPALGRPRYTNGDRSRTSADGELLDQGQTVWCYDDKGRLLRGQAFYSLDNMWFVRLNRSWLIVQPDFRLFVRPPGDPRVKRNEELRERRLKALMQEAVRQEDFLRAHRFKTLRGSKPATERTAA